MSRVALFVMIDRNRKFARKIIYTKCYALTFIFIILVGFCFGSCNLLAGAVAVVVVVVVFVQRVRACEYLNASEREMAFVAFKLSIFLRHTIVNTSRAGG